MRKKHVFGEIEVEYKLYHFLKQVLKLKKKKK